MMGRCNQGQGQLFYEFRLDEAVPDDLVRKIRALLDLSWVYAELAPYYSEIGRPSTARSASTARPARRTGRVHVGGDRPEPQTDGEADHPPAAIRRCPCSSGLGNKVSARSICRHH